MLPQGALKFARAYTEKEKVIRCGYHGWHDWCHSTRGHLAATAEATLSVGNSTILMLLKTSSRKIQVK